MEKRDKKSGRATSQDTKINVVFPPKNSAGSQTLSASL